MGDSDDSSLDRSHVWHPYTRRSAFAQADLPMIVRGEAEYLIDAQGRRYIDAISSWWCCALGHGHPAIVAAIQRQAAELQHSILGNLSHPNAARLAHRLAALMPSPDRHILFASDGSSAVEQAMKIAVQYFANIGQPKRNRFACIQDAYHGDTLGAMSVGYLEGFHRPFRPLLAPAVTLPFPDCREDGGETCLCFDQTARPDLDASRDDLAAVVVEPLCLGAAGMKMYPPCWLKAAATWCKANGVLLIVDEIAVGFGRTGRMFAFEHAGIDPDIVCVGKALSGGSLPISATIVRDGVYDTFTDQPVDRTLQHGHTFCGNPIAAAASLAALDEYAKPGFLPGVRSRAGFMRDALGRLDGHPRVKATRFLGMIGVVELNADTNTSGATRSAPSLPHRIRIALQERGILLRPLGNVLYLMPPLNIEETVLEELVETFCEAIRLTP